jgi:hypothetical protein
MSGRNGTEETWNGKLGFWPFRAESCLRMGCYRAKGRKHPGK